MLRSPSFIDRYSNFTTHFQNLATQKTKFVAAGAVNGVRAPFPAVWTNLNAGFNTVRRGAYYRRGGYVGAGKMGLEIERKFLVTGDQWRLGSEATAMRQGYLALGPPASVRVRIEGKRAYLNVKESTLGVRRAEFEYPLPLADAEELLTLCATAIVSKIRHRVRYGSHVWEVDEFEGENTGLVLAEVELEREGDPVELPPWVGTEVSGDEKYVNTYLSKRPFQTWSREPHG